VGEVDTPIGRRGRALGQSALDLVGACVEQLELRSLGDNLVLLRRRRLLGPQGEGEQQKQAEQNRSCHVVSSVWNRCRTQILPAQMPAARCSDILAPQSRPCLPL